MADASGDGIAASRRCGGFTRRPPMRNASFILAGLAAAISLISTDVSAQAGTTRRPAAVTSTLFEVTPYAGYMVFGDFASGPLGTSLANAPAPVFGAQLGMRI